MIALMIDPLLGPALTQDANLDIHAFATIPVVETQGFVLRRLPADPYAQTHATTRQVEPQSEAFRFTGQTGLIKNLRHAASDDAPGPTGGGDGL